MYRVELYNSSHCVVVSRYVSLTPVKIENGLISPETSFFVLSDRRALLHSISCLYFLIFQHPKALQAGAFISCVVCFDNQTFSIVMR